MTIVAFQRNANIDGILEDGTTRGSLPYPFYGDEDGMIQNQDLWQGEAYKIIGFQKDLAVQRIDLHYRDAFKNPDATVNMYMIVSNAQGKWSVYETAVKTTWTVERTAR
jgi:hypothetical protein